MKVEYADNLATTTMRMTFPAFQELDGNEPHWFGTFMSTVIEVVVFGYLFYGFDVGFDVDLILSYRNKSVTFGSKDNISIDWSEARNFR